MASSDAQTLKFHVIVPGKFWVYLWLPLLWHHLESQNEHGILYCKNLKKCWKSFGFRVAKRNKHERGKLDCHLNFNGSISTKLTLNRWLALHQSSAFQFLNWRILFSCWRLWHRAFSNRADGCFDEKAFATNLRDFDQRKSRPHQNLGCRRSLRCLNSNWNKVKKIVKISSKSNPV